MKLISFLILLLSILTINVSAQDVGIINYGYQNPELIIIDEKDVSNHIASNMTPIPPELHGSYELPEKFDARDKEIIFNSSIGQSWDNTCWAFASTLCAETALGGKINLSEHHAKYATSNTGNNMYGYNRAPSDGGNFLMYTAYASNWRGLVLESDDPYAYGNTIRDYETITASKPVAYHLQGTIEIPNPQSSPSLVSDAERISHINEVKYYVYEYGCCFASMYWHSTYYNSETKAYYNSKVSTKSNHAVNIIGWDDNYPKENFLTQPENNGAFIIKNSQGATGFYHYLSYEDFFAGWDASVITLVEDIYNYGEIYTHEYFEPGAALALGAGTVKATNVFTSRHDGEYVSAVGVVTKTRNLDYKIYITSTGNPTDANEENYTLFASGHLDMPGFHTIKLNDKFIIGNKGTTYSVRVLYTSNSKIDLPIEYAVGTILDTYAEAGQSYAHFGNAVHDVGAEYKANLYVKAYTDGDYSISFPCDSNIKYSINGSELQFPTENVTAGLNDELTLDFSEYSNDKTTFIVNDTEYGSGLSVTLKVTEDIIITKKEISSYIPGDINGDGRINTRDATTLLRFIAGWKQEDLITEALDTNGDGRINTRDATTLLRFIAGWKIELH